MTTPNTTSAAFPDIISGLEQGLKLVDDVVGSLIHVVHVFNRLTVLKSGAAVEKYKGENGDLDAVLVEGDCTEDGDLKSVAEGMEVLDVGDNTTVDSFTTEHVMSASLERDCRSVEVSRVELSVGLGSMDFRLEDHSMKASEVVEVGVFEGVNMEAYGRKAASKSAVSTQDSSVVVSLGPVTTDSVNMGKAVTVGTGRRLVLLEDRVAGISVVDVEGVEKGAEVEVLARKSTYSTVDMAVSLVAGNSMMGSAGEKLSKGIESVYCILNNGACFADEDEAGKGDLMEEFNSSFVHQVFDHLPPSVSFKADFSGQGRKDIMDGRVADKYVPSNYGGITREGYGNENAEAMEGAYLADFVSFSAKIAVGDLKPLLMLTLVWNWQK